MKEIERNYRTRGGVYFRLTADGNNTWTVSAYFKGELITTTNDKQLSRSYTKYFSAYRYYSRLVRLSWRDEFLLGIEPLAPVESWEGDFEDMDILFKGIQAETGLECFIGKGLETGKWYIMSSGGQVIKSLHSQYMTSRGRLNKRYYQ